MVPTGSLSCSPTSKRISTLDISHFRGSSPTLSSLGQRGPTGGSLRALHKSARIWAREGEDVRTFQVVYDKAGERRHRPEAGCAVLQALPGAVHRRPPGGGGPPDQCAPAPNHPEGPGCEYAR